MLTEAAEVTLLLLRSSQRPEFRRKPMLFNSDGFLREFKTMEEES
jgi:hypothetical protein